MFKFMLLPDWFLPLPFEHFDVVWLIVNNFFSTIIFHHDSLMFLLVSEVVA